MNNTELFIMQFYESISVICPYELSIMHIAEKLNMEVCFWNFGSAIAQFNGIHKMFINKRLSEQQQWQDFGHEMYHYFFDNTRYDLLKESYAEYGESKADYFAYHFCVPTFMLDNLKGVDVYNVMELFNVTYDFALKRIEMYENMSIARRNIYGERACEV